MKPESKAEERSDALVSMKLPPRDEKKDAEVLYPASYDQQEYPYGLRIRLEEEQLKALGISELPTVGAAITLSATGDVCSASQYETEKNGMSRSVEIQITDLGLSGKIGK